MVSVIGLGRKHVVWVVHWWFNDLVCHWHMLTRTFSAPTHGQLPSSDLLPEKERDLSKGSRRSGLNGEPTGQQTVII